MPDQNDQNLPQRPAEQPQPPVDQQQPVGQPQPQPQPQQQQPVSQPQQQPQPQTLSQPQQQYQQQPQFQPPMYNNASAAPIENKSTMYIVLSILELVFMGGLIAIWPLVMSVQYKSAMDVRDYASAAQKQKSAKTALIATLLISIGVAILCVLLLIPLMIAAYNM